MAEENQESRKEKNPPADQPAGTPAKAGGPQRGAKGEAGGGNAVEPDALRGMIDAYQILLHNQDAAGLQLRLEDLISFLAHHHQDVRLGDVGVKDGLAGENHLGGRRAAAGFRAEALRHGGVGALEDSGGLADDDGGENYALAAEAGDADFRESEFGHSWIS